MACYPRDKSHRSRLKSTPWIALALAMPVLVGSPGQQARAQELPLASLLTVSTSIGSTSLTVTVPPISVPEKIDPALQRQMAAHPTAALPVIVEMNESTAPFPSQSNVQRALQAVDLLNTYGEAIGALSLIDGAAGVADSLGIDALSLDPTVAYIYSDALVQPSGGAQAPTSVPASRNSSLYPEIVHANQVWNGGHTGLGVTVAVLDSGIARDADLTLPTNRLLASVCLAGNCDPNMPDEGGHGTHVAGIIAGNGNRSAGEFVGVAPDARLVDVRVLDGEGHGRMSSIVRGIEWVLAHAAQYNIRVINMSFGMPPQQTYRLDPMAAAAEIAWKKGIVVVAASGNRGPSSGTVDTPAIDPYVIAVGATDDQGTLNVTDDQLAWFSSWGSSYSTVSRPDLVAPGRRLVSLRAPGSYLDTLYPDRRVTAANGAVYFRLTGTSMATPVVSGAVALLLEQRPGLTPDQVKQLLVSTAQVYGQTAATVPPDPSADGSGLLAIDAAIQSAGSSPANRGQRPADSLARALYPVLYGQPLSWLNPTYLGIDWNSLTWATLNWNNVAWDNVAWDNVAWDNVAWDNVAWDNVAWDNVAWDNVAWDNVAWDNVAWDNVAWDSLNLD